MTRPALMFLLIALPLAGCRGGPDVRPYGVPSSGQLVGEAAGRPASFTAPRQGTVWVAGPGRPGSQRYIVYSGLIRAEQTITVDPPNRSLTVNGEHPKSDIESGNTYYQIWFQPAAEDD